MTGERTNQAEPVGGASQSPSAVSALAPQEDTRRAAVVTAAIAVAEADTPSVGHDYRAQLKLEAALDALKDAVAALAASAPTLPCGHPYSAVVSADEGTSYCGECAAAPTGTPEALADGERSPDWPEGFYWSDAEERPVYAPRCECKRGASAAPTGTPEGEQPAADIASADGEPTNTPGPEWAVPVSDSHTLREALKAVLDCKGSYEGTVSQHGGYPAICSACQEIARAALAAAGVGGGETP